ncbi:MAG: S-adenosylmethionine:tRNA ribosyltransferase-isomerase [Actinomycetota bacterium]
MHLDDFDYVLPEDRIAQTPVEPRDSARLLVDRGTAGVEHRMVADLVELLEPGDVLVVNDSKVIPARLRLRRRSGGAVEVLLLEQSDGDDRNWDALIRPARKMRVGEVLVDDSGLEVLAVGERSDRGDTVAVRVLGTADPYDVLAQLGEMPLPPYITAPLGDPSRYQTVYAARPGSAAAPTAGLHLTPALIERLAERGIPLLRVELLVGLDTFRPVSATDPTQHVMHSERYRVDAAVLERCRAARRVVAVGTTSVRALESAATTGELSGRTQLFIHRGYQWKVVDLMLTNFHLPRTTLLMMIDAFVGPRWRDVYRVALEEQYRFLSFGDAMLLDRRAR